MTKRFGIIGFPLKVSFSKEYFLKKFEQEHLKEHFYELFPLSDISEFQDLIKSKSDLKGLNVTFPYKKTILPYLDDLHESASHVGAVNVIKFQSDGKLTGYNSDVFGFEHSFLPLKKNHHQSALILGTGGSALSVAYVLDKHKIPFQFVSRQKKSNALTYLDLQQNGFGNANILIQTTPVGMFPNTNSCVDLPYKQITSDFLCYDLIYTPSETLFLQRAKAQGAITKNGLEMLFLQADKSWEIWSS